MRIPEFSAPSTQKEIPVTRHVQPDTPFTVRYRLDGRTSWEYLDAYNRADARRRVQRQYPRAQVLTAVETSHE